MPGPTRPRLQRGVTPAALALAASILAGCAGGTPPSPLSSSRPGETTVSVETPTQRAETIIRNDDFVAITELDVPRSTAWRHLREVWMGVGLPEPTVDERAFTLAVVNHSTARRLGGTPLSTYLSCGRSMTGWNADTHRIRLTVHTLLEPVGTSRTRLHTRVDATAMSTEGASTSPVLCTSRGALEALIARRVAERLGG
jgi:hypothetical protein